MRGEKLSLSGKYDRYLGSSPHARGKVVVTQIMVFLTRIIPACAGKSVSLPTKRKQAQDHPRMRGEKKIFVIFFAPLTGSSPHARGKEFLD